MPSCPHSLPVPGQLPPGKDPKPPNDTCTRAASFVSRTYAASSYRLTVEVRNLIVPFRPAVVIHRPHKAQRAGGAMAYTPGRSANIQSQRKCLRERQRAAHSIPPSLSPRGALMCDITYLWKWHVYPAGIWMDEMKLGLVLSGAW